LETFRACSLYRPEATDDEVTEGLLRRRSASGQNTWKTGFFPNTGIFIIVTGTQIDLVKGDCCLMPLPYCVYILFSQKDLLLYIGFTTNIHQRVRDHNDGKTKSTAPRRPLQLIFCEFYLFEADARRREMYFKTTAGKKAIKLMLGGTLTRLGYATMASIVIISEGN
jgi:putative endonuclease